MKPTKQRPSATNTGLDAYQVALEMIRVLGATIDPIQMRDAALASQLRRAASSVPLNIAEGRKRFGKDRRHHWRIASGSAAEVQACLHVAQAWGYTNGDALSEALELIDRVLAMLWRMSR